MAFRKTEAISLFRTDYSETSQIVTFYTADYGKVTVLARGCKRQKHNNLEPVDLLAHSEIVFLDKTAKGLHLLTEYTLRDNFAGLRRRLDRLYSALYVAEFLNELTPDFDPNRLLFTLALETLRRLGANGITSDRSGLSGFEALALKYLGYLPRLISDPSGVGFQCGLCNCRISEQPALRFSTRHGGVLCAGCEQENQTINVAPGVLKVMLYFAAAVNPADRNGNHNPESRLKVTLRMQDDVRRFLDYYVASIAGRELRMANWI